MYNNAEMYKKFNLKEEQKCLQFLQVCMQVFVESCNCDLKVWRFLPEIIKSLHKKIYREDSLLLLGVRVSNWEEG